MLLKDPCSRLFVKKEFARMTVIVVFVKLQPLKSFKDHVNLHNLSINCMVIFLELENWIYTNLYQYPCKHYYFEREHKIPFNL